MPTELTDLYGPILTPPPTGPPPAYGRTGAVGAFSAFAAFLLGLFSLLATAWGLVLFISLTLPVSVAAWGLSAFAGARAQGPCHALAEIGRWCAIVATSFVGVVGLSMLLHRIAGGWDA